MSLEKAFDGNICCLVVVFVVDMVCVGNIANSEAGLNASIRIVFKDYPWSDDEGTQSTTPQYSRLDNYAITCLGFGFTPEALPWNT